MSNSNQNNAAQMSPIVPNDRFLSFTEAVPVESSEHQLPSSPSAEKGEVEGINIRSATPADAENCGRVIYGAFRGIADKHNFPRDFSSMESAMQIAAMCVNEPNCVGFIAEGNDGQFLGSNFLWRFNEIAGVGPVSVDPDVQATGVGKRLMQTIIEAGADAPGMRLVQDAFNTISMPLYAGLGFDVVEPLVLMHGVPEGETAAATKTEVRPLEEKDLAACAELCRKAHGFERINELKIIAGMFPAYVAMRDNRIVAYASAPNFWQMNHAVAETVEDMQNLLGGASRLANQPLSFLLPTRQAELFRWCLTRKLRVVKPMTLMAMGSYRQPTTAYLPSVLY